MDLPRCGGCMIVGASRESAAVRVPLVTFRQITIIEHDHRMCKVAAHSANLG